MKITYKQFKKFEALYDMVKSNSESVAMLMIESFSGLTKEEIRELPVNEFELITLRISEQLNSKPTLSRTFDYGGITYGLVPNFSKISTGELIDLDTLFMDGNILGVMAILYRPIISSSKVGYSIEVYQGKVDTFKDLDWHIVQGALDFFISSYHHLKNFIHTSTNK